jgi:17beta-estradiol 17-dehydrogenase / very-long-chain 3-oxoacyl-CoA reductase
MNLTLLALAGIGAIAVLRFVYFLSQFLAFHLLIPSEPLKKYKRANTTAYALITGSSAGIGLGIAQELVRQGFGVILLGHLPDELAAAASTLRQIAPAAQIRTLVLNARTATPSELESALQPLTSTLRITILVNNVGGNPIKHGGTGAAATPAFRTHATYSASDVDAVIDMNARFMARLTALLLPHLSQTPTRTNERSLVLTLSSGAHVGIPWLVMYGATKAFNRAFGFGLARELAADPATAHVDSLVVVPGEVRTQGNCRDLPAGSPSWDEFGRHIVRKVDGAVARGWREMHPFWWHGVEDVLVRVISEGMRTKGVTEQLARKKAAWDVVYEKEK